MKNDDLHKFPEHIQNFIFIDADLATIDISKKFALSVDQKNYIDDLEDDIFLKKINVLDLPNKLDKMPEAGKIDVRLLCLDLAYKIFWPLQELLENVDRLIIRLGGKVPHIKPLQSDNQDNPNNFPGHATGTVKEMMSKYQDFKDLRLSSNKIKDKKRLLVSPTVDNWIKDYVHFVGASSHDSLNRAQYLSKDEDVLGLNSKEADSLRYFLLSYDDNVAVTFDYDNSILNVSEEEEAEKSETKTKDSDSGNNMAINNIERQIKELAENMLPEDIIMSEAENDINKVRDILWQSIGVQDKDKAISCLSLMIKRRALDQAILEDNRFKNILKRFVGVKYGHALEQSVSTETDKLLLRRLFLEMILSDKFRLPDEEMFITAFYLSNIVSGSGQLVYFDKTHKKLKWREVQTLGNKFSWVYPV